MSVTADDDDDLDEFLIFLHGQLLDLDDDLSAILPSNTNRANLVTHRLLEQCLYGC